jgi:hypothetical protein
MYLLCYTDFNLIYTHSTKSVSPSKRQKRPHLAEAFSQFVCAALCSTVFASARVHEICSKHLRLSGQTRVHIFMHWWFKQDLAMVLATPRDSNPIVEWIQLLLLPSSTSTPTSSTPKTTASQRSTSTALAKTSTSSATQHRMGHSMGHEDDNREADESGSSSSGLIRLIVDECCGCWRVGHGLLLLTLIDHHHIVKIQQPSRYVPPNYNNVNNSSSRSTSTNAVTATVTAQLRAALRDLSALCLVWRLLGDGVRQCRRQEISAHQQRSIVEDKNSSPPPSTKHDSYWLTVNAIRTGKCSLARLVAAQAVAGLTPWVSGSQLLLSSASPAASNEKNKQQQQSVGQHVVDVVLSRLLGSDGGSTFAAILENFSQLQSGLGRDCVLAWVLNNWAEEESKGKTSSKGNSNEEDGCLLVMDLGVFAPLLQQVTDVRLRAACAELVWNTCLRAHVASVIKVRFLASYHFVVCLFVCFVLQSLSLSTTVSGN